MSWFTPQQCDESCECAPCVCELRASITAGFTFERCSITFEGSIVKVCNGVTTELEPSDYNIWARLESFFEDEVEQVFFLGPLEDLVLLPHVLTLDGRIYRLTVYQETFGDGTGTECQDVIEDAVDTFDEDRGCFSDPEDCCSLSSIALTVGAVGTPGACCWAGGSATLIPGYYFTEIDAETGPYFGDLIEEPCIWSWDEWIDMDCNGVGACETISLPDGYTYHYFKTRSYTVYVGDGVLYAEVVESRYTVRVIDTPELPYSCTAYKEINPWGGYAAYRRDSCTSGVMTRTDAREYDCPMPTTITIAVS